ncbi:MAG: hypothetical protein OXS30_11990 [Chloroflexota bacterium]|nr:hypothetical protein [Chloroflexota bacterium]
MAIFNAARLRDILVRGQIAEEAPAQELVDELEDQLTETLSTYPTLDRLAAMEARLLQAMAELKQHQAESEARMAEMLRQQSVHINQAVGIVLAGIALAVGIVLGFG